MKKKIFILVFLFMFWNLSVNKNVSATENKELVWKIHSTTPLEETVANWKFRVGDFNKDGIEDIYAINKARDQDSAIDIRILNGTDEYKSVTDLITPLASVDDKWTFEVGDYNNDGFNDIYCIQKDGENHTNIHILNGADNFKSFLLEQVLPIESTDDSWEFKIGDYNNDTHLDLYCIKKNAVNHTEVHILNGADNFKSYLLEQALPIENTDYNWDFGIGDNNSDGHPDIYCIKKLGANNTEVHILDGNSCYQNFLLDMPTIMKKTDFSSQFIVGNGNLNLYCISKFNTDTHKIEVHKFGWKEEALPKAKGSVIVDEAMKYLNIPYLWGGTTVSGFDCSGFTQYVYLKEFGIDIGRTTYEQINSGKEVSKEDLKPGDLVFEHPGHVQIYVGNGQVIHSPKTGDVIKVSPLGEFWRARRIVE
ncbi:NlpC/P60 family protein [Clostridium sp. SHJSY1]|uniref:NlpC/P60 family protein n=1 Tax=Clostridium sp. SHJSY1 TaxID=2942483 RepID=UPI00287629E2|nr:NlpC/P60 family protein [Clostridium sp. SHJSY1]MDS0527994.1 NlpC/P60 family protein [Clostridium sp. SHJSY1]